MMKSLEYKNVALDEMGHVAHDLLSKFPTFKTFLLEGNLGAGKTTLSKLILKELGVLDMVSSPTFSIVNEYSNQKGDQVYHLDCYRLKSLEEGLDIGLDEVLDENTYCLIEWPEVIFDLIQGPFVKISIQQEENATRHIIIN